MTGASLAEGQTVYDLLLVVFAALVIPALSVINGRRLARHPEAPLIPRYLRTMARGWLAVTAVVVLWRVLHRDFATLGLDWPIGLPGQAGLALVAVAALANGLAVTFARRIVKPEWFAALREQMRRLKILPRTAPELLVFLAVSVTAGVWEELLYRGYLIWFLSAYGGTVLAVALSSVAFGLGHFYQGVRGVVTTTVLGLGFAVGYVVTGSLWWLMGAHALVDLTGGFMGWRVLRVMERQPDATAETIATQ